MNPTQSELALAVQSGNLGNILRGEQFVFSTPPEINDDMRPTDHSELLDKGLYPLADTYGAALVQGELERALTLIGTDALGVFCAHQCFYIEVLNESRGLSPFSLNRGKLPKILAQAFERQRAALHSLQLHPGDLENDRSYKVTLSGMRILQRDYKIDWGTTLHD